MAQGLPGTQVQSDGVTQYRVATKVFNHPGTNGVRLTVLETQNTNGNIGGQYGGGPFFAMGELIVLDANGDTIPYTPSSNADHNSGGAGTDGAGLPALNDGLFNNFFHSSWGGTEPGGYHYIEMAFEKSVDAFQVIWYTRPNQHVNRPSLAGLTPAGVDFTEAYGEYQFELGEDVNSLEALSEAPGLFTFYVEGPASYTNDEGTETTGPGNIYVTLTSSVATTGDAAEANPKNIMQLIPAKEGKFVVYAPVTGAYLTNPDNWTNAWVADAGNGWAFSHATASNLGEFTFTLRQDGEFEISTEITRVYVNETWNDLDEPMTVYVGYDMRGNLKIFSFENKDLLEAGDLVSGGFHLPVDFGFKLNKANVADGTVEPISVQSICENVINPTIADAKARLEQYGDHEGNVTDSKEALEEAIQTAEEAIAANDIAGIFAAKDELATAISYYMSERVYLYMAQVEELRGSTEFVNPPYDATSEGKWPISTQKILDDADYICTTVESNWETLTPTQIDNYYSQVQGLIEQFLASALRFSTFPSIVDNISAALSPNYPNNAVWNSSAIVLHQAVNGIRLTFLDRHLGTAGDGGNWPMIALGELRLYDENGEEVELTEDLLWANHTETQEGFESTVARLCDGKWGQGDKVGTEGSATQSYYHSPWSGSEPQEFICIDVTFPAPMSSFSVELYSRDKTTSNGAVSLFPKKLAITEVGVGYDPLLFAENPYNVRIGQQVVDAAELETGLYIIKGLLNTKSVNVLDEETGNIVKSEPEGEAKFYAGTSRFHANAAAVRANCVYRITKNDDGTYTFTSLSAAKYWPTTTEEENAQFVAATASKSKAAKVKVAASAATEGAFVLYEEQAGRVTKDSIDADADGVADSERVVETPYVVYMDWYSGLAARAVTDPQPKDVDGVLDAQGDSLCFNKANGEGEWQIYKVTMDNPDYYWLENMLGIVSGLGLEVGPDPGCVASLGDLQEAYEKAQVVVADSAYDEATAAAAALAEKIGLAETLEKNPMVPGVYRIQSGYAEFYNKQGHTKSIYVTEDAATLGWKKTEENNPAFYFHFTESEDRGTYIDGGVLSEEEAANLYQIRAIGTTVPGVAYYISEAAGQSEAIQLAEEWPSAYLVKPGNGSSFNIANPNDVNNWCLHQGGHNSGAGVSGTIVYWTASPGASQWRLVKVDYETSIEDLVAAEGDEVVSVSYYTVGGASSSAPAKGVNIVKVVYANGVVETKKVLVK